MAHPRRSAPASAPRTSSVALSLASAAAALRAQEWHDDDARGRPDAGYSRYASSHNFQEEQDVAYDREAFYEELRAHHRSLTQRQRLARELFNQQTQTQNFMPQNQTPNLRRPQWQGRRYQTHSPVSSADAAGGHYRAAYAASPAVQLVATMVPRAQINVDRRLSAGQMEPDRIIIENQRDSKPTQMQLPSPGSGQRLASPGAGQGPGGSDTRWPQAAAPARKPSSTDEADENVQKPPSVVEDPDNDDDADAEAAVVEDDAGKKKQKKRVRYLRDTDRRNIIKRIENGEKQAALAREFGVTRAAICHIKKNRFEILSRYNLLVKSAQEMDRAENFGGPPGVEMMVHEVRANSVLLLMTMLRDNRSNGDTFRRVAGRLIMILLEEALAVLGTESVEVITGTGHLYHGLERKHQFCGVSIGAEGFPFLVLFHQMEPDAPQGSIHVEPTTDRRGQRAWRLDHMDLPANIIQFKILLFSSTCSTGEAECKAIEALCSVGSDESSISLVVILAASDGIVKISDQFPQVKIITAGIDSKVDPHTDSIVPGFGDFVSRYNSS